MKYANKLLDEIELAGFKPLHRANFKSGWSLISSFERV
jgi:hypothetical protein